MNATQTTAFPAVSSPRSPVAKTAFPITYMSQSPRLPTTVCVYNEDGTGKVLYCNSTGDVRLLDGKTGELNDTLSISDGVIEASPAVYDNMAVVGTRDCKIWGIELQ